MMTAAPEQDRLAKAWSDKMTNVALLGIVNPTTAKTLNTIRSLPKHQLFSDAVRNTPGAQIADEGLLMRIQRSQHPGQALQPSVRGGVFYLPEGASQAKHYSTGKSGYGGSEKIAGQTLISNPLFAKGATGGKAPERAFNAINGKGAYEAMRSDALKSVSGWNMSHADKVEKAHAFLQKYAPEMANYAGEIVERMKSGNQLPYALQEAAVSSAVRRAGHDAVLGYSMSRKTKQPFLSELFDVREAQYPDKFGTPTEIWDAFK